MGSGVAGATVLRSAARLGLAGAFVLVLGAGIVLAGTPARGIAGASSVVYLDAPPTVDPASLPTVAIDPKCHLLERRARQSRRRPAWPSRWPRTWRWRTWPRCAAMPAC